MKCLHIQSSILIILLFGMFTGCVPANTSSSAMPTNVPVTSSEFPSSTLIRTPTFTPVPPNTSLAQPMISRCVQIQQKTGAGILQGKVVLFFQANAGGGTYLLDLSSQTRSLIEKSTLDVAVSPDGESLAYRDVDRKSIVVRDVNGQVVLTIPDPEDLLTPIMWLDNNRLVLSKIQGNRGDPMAPLPSLEIYNPFTNEKQEWLSDYPNIYTAVNLGWGWGNHFVVNPQLSYLVYPIFEDFGPLVIWDIKNNQEVGRVNAWIAEPRFSPDGDEFVVPLAQGSLLNSPGTDLGIVGINGEITRLTYFTDNINSHQKGYEWSPDGKRIAFLLKLGSKASDVHNLAVISVDTHQVINYCINGSTIMWSPDGKYILLNQDIEEGENFAVYVIRLDDGVSWKISENSVAHGWMLEP
jgi:hypothetical protein